MSTTKRASTPAILAATFGWDIGEVSEHRYQPTRTPRAVYAIGEQYFTVSATPPVLFGWTWTKWKDQFFAEQAGTVVWVSEADESAARR